MGGGDVGQDDAGEFEPVLDRVFEPVLDRVFDPAPLILTLRLAPEAQARFDRLRALHFPADRNFIAAHVTLFHHLPPAPDPSADVAALVGRTAGFEVAVTGLRSLGRGVAFTLEAEALLRLRADLARRWAGGLTAQDRQGFRPHVTIQNKVTAEAARRLLAQMSAEFVPFSVSATGLGLWRYRGGPWEAAGSFAFS